MTNALVVVSLALSKDEQTFETLKNLILQVNVHVDSRGYAIVLLRTKKNVKKEIKKTWFICDRERKTSQLSESEKRHIISRHIKCFFSAIDKLINDYWLLKIINSHHNHASSFVKAHSVHRKVVSNEEV